MQTLLKYDWKFIKEDIKDAYKKDFDDSAWRTVRIPHDYAIEGPFHPENDKQISEVVADGIHKPIVHVGRTGALPIADKAWYRRKFSVNRDSKHIFLEFDGVMSHCSIYVNGKKCGGRVYGYSSFSVDISDAVILGEDNTLAVEVSPLPCASRWYTGAGIYRNVRLVEKREIYLPYCPVYVRSEVKNEVAFVDIDTKVCGVNDIFDICVSVYDENNNEVIRESKSACASNVYTVFKLSDFKSWNILNSYLYKLEVKILKDNEIYDIYETKFGIRTIEFDTCNGFYLNGEKTQLKGVCMHHDLGALGAAFNRSAAKRQIEKLIEIGVNAYRCAHNPTDPQILDLCDEYGIVVMDEAYDEWQMKKVDNGYGKFFDKCFEEDLVDMIVRDRNHPCVIMWSIGNEILEQKKEDGYKIARILHNLCKKHDPTRPTTAGFSMTIDAFRNGLADEVDLGGINYKPHLYESLHKDYPHIPLYGSETGSTVSTRGYFSLPAIIEHPVEAKDNLMESSYDLASPNWAYPDEREFLAQEKYDYVFGNFVWSGFDYLGEPTPYRNNFPARSSYFGIYDLAGMKKTRCYSYISRWTDKDVIHLFPHWNWKEGDFVDVHAYSNYDELELFLNGKSLGIAKKDPNDEIKSHRLVWEKVKYERGELKAIAIKNPELYDIVNTADEPYEIILIPERTHIEADGDDVVYVECSIVDKSGIVCPLERTQLNFEVNGAGEYLAADNGHQAEDRTFSEKYCNTLSGKCMVIIRSIEEIKGEIILTVSSDKYETKSVSILSK